MSCKLNLQKKEKRKKKEQERKKKKEKLLCSSCGLTALSQRAAALNTVRRQRGRDIAEKRKVFFAING